MGGQFLWIFIRNHSRVEQRDSASLLKEPIEFSVALICPLMVPEIENDHVSGGELRRAGPFPGFAHRQIRAVLKQAHPTLLPGRIVVLTGTMILFAGHKHDVQRTQISGGRSVTPCSLL